ncbi:hypothetical protein LTR53_017806, partial [Teratosphaeriaceae sp. CCFEE 6253]
MAEPARTDLPYGHFGHAAYDVDEQNWSFERHPGAGDDWRPLGLPRLVVEPALDAPASLQAAQSALGGRRLNETNAVIKRFPELQPASPLLPQLLRVSEAVVSATARHDPLQGDLLAVGTIPSGFNRKPIAVAAFPAGPTGGDLGLTQVHWQRRGWHDTKLAWIEAPTIHGDEVKWKGKGAPIQQVVFADAIEGSDCFVAVRMLTRTLVFRPATHDQPLRTSSTSRLEANLSLEVPIAMTGGVSHTDVAFNPWYVRQFALVDQNAGWSIWELAHRTTSNSKLICQHFANDESAKPVSASDDKWARIVWVHNPNTVAVCTRRRLVFYDTTGARSRVMTPISDDYPAAGWYLGLLRIPSRPDQLVVLTPNHLCVYQFQATGVDACDVKLAARIRHFRNPDDTTLTLTAFALADATLVVLRSHVEPVMTSYTLHMDMNGELSFSLPAAFALPESVASCSTTPSIAGLRFASVRYGASSHHAAEGSLAYQHREHGRRFALLTVLGKDHALHDILYSSCPASIRVVEPPTWEAMIPA